VVGPVGCESATLVSYLVKHAACFRSPMSCKWWLSLLQLRPVSHAL